MQIALDSPGSRCHVAADVVALALIGALMAAMLLALVRAADRGGDEAGIGSPPRERHVTSPVLAGEIPIYFLVTEGEAVAVVRASDGSAVLSMTEAEVSARTDLINDQNRIMAELGQPTLRPVLIRLSPAATGAPPGN